MKKFYIIKDNDPYQTWNWMERNWCWDVDGVYDDSRDGYAYTSKQSAKVRMKALTEKGLLTDCFFHDALKIVSHECHEEMLEDVRKKIL